MKKWEDELKRVAKKLGWHFEKDELEITLSKDSPAGQDFHVVLEADSMDKLLFLLSERIDYFNVSEETYLWLDNREHGKNGAPSDMRDIYNDMESCVVMMEELYDELYEEFLKSDEEETE